MANSSSGRSFLTHQLDYLSLLSCWLFLTDIQSDRQDIGFTVGWLFLCCCCCCWAPWNCLMTRRMMNHPLFPPSLLLFLCTQKTSNFIPPSVAVVVVVWLRDFGRWSSGCVAQGTKGPFMKKNFQGISGVDWMSARFPQFARRRVNDGPGVVCVLGGIPPGS